LALAPSGIRTVDVHPKKCRNAANTNRSVGYFGNDSDIKIGGDVEAVAAGCFSYCDSIVSVRVDPGCRVSVLGRSAFENSSSLRSICIPSSIEIISDSCFKKCTSLSNFTFAARGRISILGDSAFQECSSLESMIVPASVGTIGSSCFAGCRTLYTLTLQRCPGWKLGGQ
jgi:hypothetical protein